MEIKIKTKPIVYNKKQISRYLEIKIKTIKIIYKPKINECLNISAINESLKYFSIIAAIAMIAYIFDYILLF